ELKLKLLISPWGELKDAYVSESSGNRELDNICLEAALLYNKFQPFPEELGEDNLWIDIPIIFDVEFAPSVIVAKKDQAEAQKKDLKPKRRRRRFKKGESIASPIIQNLGINEAVDMALENRLSRKIAEKEIGLSRLKIREARRALYPTASLNYMETTGITTSNVQDFTDKEYKLKFEIPVYYGWRLKYAVDQAMSNVKASQQNYNKVRQDVQFEVETAFYAYIANKSNLTLQKDLLKEAELIHDTAKKRFDSKLITKAEYLQVSSQLKQIKYQLQSSENDVVMAKLTLVQTMNLESPKEVEAMFKGQDSFFDKPRFDPKFIGPVELGVGLEECLDLAFRYRPDLKAKKYMIDFNDYERKIVLSKNQFSVDVAGSYGKSGGAFESETLTLEKDWYIGLKVTKSLGGNTLSTSYTEEETSEKHGQTSRTESISRAVEFRLLDNLESFSEKKSADIALDKSKEEFGQIKHTIFKEVKEAYLDYQKGLVQEMSSRDKIAHKEEELKITKARAGLNETPLSEVMKAHVSLTDERLFYVEAVVSLYQSLVKLNKATGYVLFLDD
ncbi:MAG: TolC family protein, partial [Candidatus Omnitrophota bacterium]|nr:TolC family protein [Candidatus Omnitrophota bacterium]